MPRVNLAGRAWLMRQLVKAFNAAAAAVGMDTSDDPMMARGLAPAWQLGRERRRELGIFAAAAAAETATALSLPLAVADAVDAAARGRAGSELVTVGALAVVAVVATAFVSGAGARVTRRGGASLGARIGAHSLLLGLTGRRAMSDSDVVHRTVADSAGVASLPIAFVQMVRLLVVAVGALLALLLVHWLIALTAVLVIVVVMRLAAKLQRGFREAMVEVWDRSDHLTGHLADAIEGRRTIAACATVSREVARVRRSAADVLPAVRRLEHAKVVAVVLVDAVHVGLRITLLPVTGWLLVERQVTAGELVAVLGYTELIAMSVMMLVSNGISSVARGRVAGVRALQVLEAPRATEPAASPAAAPTPPVAICLRGVRVTTGDGPPVLDGVDLDIPAGASVAIVGRSGAGKSTLAQLVGRLLDPSEGRVYLNGVDARHLDESDLRRLVSYAFERPALLGTTVGDTLTYGGEYECADVERACAVAAADGFIARLPGGWDTPLDDAPLSGGEQQRLGLARVALRRSPIVVFDDALSSLDVATEAQVAASFDELRRGRTTVTVAHRASTAARADLVAWLDDARIRAVAPHAELWRDPAYRGSFDVVEQDVS